jgi:hypothetical protein
VRVKGIIRGKWDTREYARKDRNVRNDLTRRKRERE